MREAGFAGDTCSVLSHRWNAFNALAVHIAIQAVLSLYANVSTASELICCTGTLLASGRHWRHEIDALTLWNSL